MFATGIENSSPTINAGCARIDEMEKCGHYKQWQRDFDCVEELGICFLRYGVPLHRVFLKPGKYDWEFTDLAFNDLRRRKILPIVDLCHFGVPDWIGNFQNPDFPALFAEYQVLISQRVGVDLSFIRQLMTGVGDRHQFVGKQRLGGDIQIVHR